MNLWHLVCFLLGLAIGLSVNAVRIISTDLTCYKQGQVDAINGKIYWELQKQNDGSVQWVFTGETKK